MIQDFANDINVGVFLFPYYFAFFKSFNTFFIIIHKMLIGDKSWGKWWTQLFFIKYHNLMYDQSMNYNDRQ